MAIPQRKQTSIILTFRILQFVKQLRRRVQPRVLDGSIDASNLGNRSFPGIRRIPKGLSRISIDAKQSRRVANRICKARQRNPKSSRSLFKPGTAPPARRNLAGDEVQHVLSSIDNTLNLTGSVFSTIAGNSELFLKHDHATIYEGCSMHETIQLLVAVFDAINVLSECRLQYGDEWLMAQGLDVGLSMDENFIANYEHMLLRLETALIEALARKAFEELLHGGHDKKQRKLLSWFTEFAEKPQPLSTSFPWTIKPSLAVLWGVCWMFYGSPDHQSTGGANDRVRMDRVLQNLDLQWDTGASSEYVNLGRELIGGEQAHATNVNVGLDNDLYEARNTDTWESDLTSDPLTTRLPSVVVSHAVANGSRAEPSPHPNQDTYYRHVAQDFPPVSPANFYLPHNQGTAQPLPLTVFPNLGSDYQNPWHLPYTSSTLPPDNTRHLIASARDPRVRVTEAARSGFFAPPQTGFGSSDIYHQVRQPEASPLYLNNPYNFYTHQQDMMTSDMSPTTIHVPHKHERTTSITSNTDMPTPVSISGHRSPLTSPTAGPGERTHITSPRSHTHSRGISVDSMLSQDSNDDGSLRKNHSYKRAEEPPRNQDGKMACKYHECHGLVFDRKCEWSKHMDKHDRPYKCNVTGCEKLQGFTYSGGLLRHEREVHKMHGGTKKSLFCPFHDCKRSSGAGFTRKENLAEHIRRVHRRTSMSADMHGLIIRRDTTLDRSPLPESRVVSASESPFSRTMDFQERDDEVSLKRKRGGSDSGFSDRGNEDMRNEIKRLRMENEEKDSRLRQLEQAVMALQQQGRR